MRTAPFYFILFVLCFTPVPAHSTPPSITMEWSHRQLALHTVDPAIPEGSLFVSFHSDQTINPVEPPVGLEYLTPSSWRLNLSWDDLDPFSIAFANEFEESTQVTVAYTPIMPLDPLLHELPVVHVISDPAHLWHPETGIYIFGLYDNCLQHGEEWERPATFQFFHGSNSPFISEQVGIRINGNYTRSFDQKSLRLYFDDYGAEDAVDFDFFGNPPASFQRLILRTGRFPGYCFNSVFAEGLFIDLGHLGSRSRDVCVYLNQEYWGFFTLRERIDSKFIEHTHDLDQSGYALIKDGSPVEGDSATWWSFLDSCGEDQDFASHQWFSTAIDNLDLDTFLDWLLINIFCASADNGGPNNVSLLRLGSGPWQFIMYDEDAICKDQNLAADFFRFFSVADEAEYDKYHPPIFFGPPANIIRWSAPFRGLMQNSEFKIQFKNRFEELMANEFSESALQARITEIGASQGTEMTRHLDRWGYWSNAYNSHLSQISAWVTQRRPFVMTQFDSFLESYRVPVELNQFYGNAQIDGTVQLNWRTQSEEDCSGFVLYRGTSPENMAPVASFETHSELVATGAIWQMAEYDFIDKTAGPDFPLYYQLARSDSDGLEEFLPWVLSIDPVFPPSPLRINEFLALNTNGIQDETGTCEDWVEIFNTSDEFVNLTGLYLSDNLAATTKWEFPSVTLEPGGFLLVWCDSDPNDGPLHTTFKLSASGEDIGLFGPLSQGNQLIDGYVFGPQSADVSEGRFPDGASKWTYFTNPTPGLSNLSFAPVQTPQSGPLALGPNHPNPFNPSTTIHFHLAHPAEVSIEMFDINGRKIRTLMTASTLASGHHQTIWNGCDDAGRALSSGTYFARAQAGDEQKTLKLSLIK